MRLVVVPEHKERYDQSKFGHNNNIEMDVYFLIEESSKLSHGDEGLTYNYHETLYQPVIVRVSALKDISLEWGFEHFVSLEIGTNNGCRNKPRHVNCIQFKLGPQRNNHRSVVLGEPIVEGCFHRPPVTAGNEHPIPIGSVLGIHLQWHWG